MDTEPRRLWVDEYHVPTTCASASTEGWKGCMQALKALLTPRCLVDTEPRRLTVDDFRVLNNCAEMVVRRLEAERFAIDHAGAATQVGFNRPNPNNCAEMVVRRLEAERFAIDHAGAATQVDPNVLGP